MPSKLRRDTIRLLEASCEALHIAVTQLGSSKRIEHRTNAAYASEIGLIGASAELAMSACLVQALGPDTVLIPANQHFKSFSEIKDDFRKLVRNASPNVEFIFQDVANRSDHQEKLLEYSSQFSRLGTVRAAGFHGGIGLPHETTVMQANLVADFLGCLAISSRIRIYLPQIPRCLLYNKERIVFIEDLVGRLKDEDNPDKAALLASVYLVLPEVSDDEPEWISAFNRLTIAPHKRDIHYLLNILSNTLPASLKRATTPGDAIPVRVEKGNPNSLPITPQFLRSQLNDPLEQWEADVGLANGRLEEGMLDLPPAHMINDVFSLGLENTKLLDNNAFTAHRSWPAIVSSLNVPGNGTPGPYWFIVRKTNDLGQLVSILKRVRGLGQLDLQENIDECISGIEAIRNDKYLSASETFVRELLLSKDKAVRKKEQLLQTYARNLKTVHKLPDEYKEEVTDISEDGKPIGNLLSEIILDSRLVEKTKRYWGRTLADAAMDVDDIPALVKLAHQSELGPHTFTKKALRRIDFYANGPSVK